MVADSGKSRDFSGRVEQDSGRGDALSGSQVNVPRLDTASTSSTGRGTWGSAGNRARSGARNRARSGARNEGISGSSVAGIVARRVASSRARRAIPASARRAGRAAQRGTPDRGASTNDVVLTAGTVLGRRTAGTGSWAVSTVAVSAVTGVLDLFFSSSEGGENGSRDGQKSGEELHV